MLRCAGMNSLSTPQNRTTLVTGAAGFVASWLLPELLASGRRVVAVRRPDRDPGDPAATWIAADLRAPGAISEIIERIRPDEVVHLAALAHGPDVQRDPEEALRINVGAVQHLIRGLLQHAPLARLLFVSSGEVYGPQSRDALACDEKTVLQPASHYAATKVAGEALVQHAIATHGLNAFCARPFNHTGPGRPSYYAESSFASQIVEIEKSSQPAVLHVGDLSSTRDYSDVRDVVAAYRLLLDRAKSGTTYNVCSGIRRSIGSVLEELTAHASRTFEIKVDAARLRTYESDTMAPIGDPAAMRALDWEPRFSFERTLGDLLDAWRVQL